MSLETVSAASPSPRTSLAPLAPRETPARRGGRWLYGLGLAAYVLSRLYLQLAFIPIASDVPLYFDYAVQGVDWSRVPFKEVRIEYPPAAYWVMALPRYIDPVRITPELVHKRGLAAAVPYWRAFRRQMLVLELAAFALFLGIVRRRRPQRIVAACWGYVLATSILGHVLYDRLDAGLLFVWMLWGYAWVRSSEGKEHSSAWGHVSYLVLGFGAAYKLVPVLVVPFLALADWQARRQWRDVARSLALLAAAAAVPFLVHYPAAGGGVLGFLKYHGERGIEIESLYATLLMVLSNAGLEIYAAHSYGGWNVESGLSSAMVAVSNVALVCLLAGAATWALAKKGYYDRTAAYRLALLVAAAVVTVGKVLSPQYLIWAIPLLLLLGCELVSTRQCAALVAGAVLVAALTTWVFPYHFFPQPAGGHALLPDLDWLPSSVLVLRNALLVVLVGWLGATFFRRPPGVSNDHTDGDGLWSAAA